MREARDLIRQRRNIPDDEEDDAIKFDERNIFEEAVTINTVMTLWEGHGTSEEEVLKDHKKTSQLRTYHSISYPP